MAEPETDSRYSDIFDPPSPYDEESNRDRESIISECTNASDAPYGKRKTHVGPWNLGKDLGKGASARVRMARHAATGQMAAVKIIAKKRAKMLQAGSLAVLDVREPDNGDNHMPFSIEREVAIMKLIDHPNVMKLLDIWENHKEM